MFKNKFINYFIVLSLIFIILIPYVNAGFWDFFKIGKKVSTLEFKNTEKQIAKKELSNIEKNAIRGAEWELKVQKIICSKYTCVYDLNKIPTKSILTSQWDDTSRTYVIVGGKNTKDFINQKRLNGGYFFTHEPDFLEVTEKNNRIEKLKVIDAKTSFGAKRQEQENAFKSLCEKSVVNCEVD